MIRAFCLLDSSNRCIFHWASKAAAGGVFSEKLGKELLGGKLPKAIRDFVRGASLGNEKVRVVEYEGSHVTVCAHRGFLIVADVSSEHNYSKTMPRLLAEIDRMISEEPLSFSLLLSDIDMPGRNRLVSQISAILESPGNRS